MTPVPYTALLQQFRSPPAGKLFCLHGDRSVFRVSLYAASHVLVGGHPVALVDGSNHFDLYYIAEVARRMAAGQRAGSRRITPEELLERIFISRAFTCYQMEATITERLPRFVGEKRTPIIMIFGLLDTFYDEQAPLFEVRASVQRVLVALRTLKHANHSILLASLDTRPASKERGMLFPMVCSAMDEVFSIFRQEETLRIQRETKRSTTLMRTGQSSEAPMVHRSAHTVSEHH
jgi:hypothetical protein